MTTGAKIKTRREDMGISQIELAQKIGVSQVHMSGVESGERSLNMFALARCAKTLEVSTDWLLEN